ncbi:MAG: tetratricopeptide repeat protein [Bacteroidia bacterium]|nr:tetratricopeptide repeat protein [Bacteroidia bacterium]
MKSLLTSLLLAIHVLYFANPITAQNKQIDSLLHLISNDKDDTIKSAHLNKLSTEYFYVSNFNKCLLYSKQNLELSLRINYKRGVIRSYNKMGIAFDNMGNYPEALSSYYKLLKYSKYSTDKIFTANAMDNIGSVFLRKKKYQKALYYYYTSLKVYKEQKDTSNYIGSYYNIGVIYTLMGKYAIALDHFKTAIFFTEKNNDELNKGISYNGIADVYIRLANYTKANEYSVLALKYYEIIQNKSGIALCYNNLAQINIAQGNTKPAYNFAYKALQMSLEINDKEITADSYQYLTVLDSLKKDYASAFKNYKLHIAYRDSLLNQETIEKTTQLSMQYEFDKQQQTQSYIQHQKDNHTTTLWTIIIMIIVTILGLVFTALMFSRIKEKQQRLLLLQKLNETELQVLRLQINPHFMFNALNSIYSLIISNDVAKAETYLIKFSRMLRNSLTQSVNDSITLQEELATLADYIDLEQLRLNNSFIYTISVDSTVSELCKIPPLLLQPFVENAILHGLKNKVSIVQSQPNILSITASIQHTMLCITITDNGIGRKAAEELKATKTTTHTSRGIAITTQRIVALSTKYLQASVKIINNIDNNGTPIGTSVHIQLPIII